MRRTACPDCPTRPRRRHAIVGGEPLEGRALLSRALGHPNFPATAQVRPADQPATGLNIVYEDVNGRQERLDVYLPPGTAPTGGWPVIVAIHGGGWRRFDKGIYGPPVASQFVPRGFAVVVPNYLLSAPGQPSWPQNFEDVRNAVRWVRSNAGRYDFNPDRIAALGESAGAHLAALLGTDPNGPLPGLSDPTAPDVSAAVEAVVAFYPPTDLARLAAESPGGALAASQFLGGTPAQQGAVYSDASPTSHVAPGDPPILIIEGTADTLVPPNQAQELAADLTAAGDPNELVLVPGAVHGFEFRPEGQKTVPQILAFLAGSWNDKRSTS